MILQEIPLAAVDFSDESFRLRDDLELDRMAASLQAVGQISPVLLMPDDSGAGHRIVCGFRRLHGLRRVGATVAAAQVLAADELNEFELFLRAVWDQLSQRVPAPLEAARILYLLRHRYGVPEESLTARFLPALGLSPHRNVLCSYLDLHRLHPGLRDLASNGHLTLASAERLARLPEDVQSATAPVLGVLRLSASLQREVLDLVEDLAAMNSVSMADVLNGAEILAVAGDGRLSGFQKGEAVHRCLYRLRNPRLSKAREAFSVCKAQLELPGSIRISPDPFFESPRLRVEFDAPSARAFRETVAALERACGAESLERLFQVS